MEGWNSELWLQACGVMVAWRWKFEDQCLRCSYVSQMKHFVTHYFSMRNDIKVISIGLITFIPRQLLILSLLFSFLKKCMCSLLHHSALYSNKPSFTSSSIAFCPSSFKLNFAVLCLCFGVQVGWMTIICIFIIWLIWWICLKSNLKR